MMGQAVGQQDRLFYEFNLEDRVPTNHLLRRIEPHIPVWDKGKRDDGTLSPDDFAFDKDGDVYICPQGKALKTTGRVHDGKTLLYGSSKHDCDPRPLKPKGCPRAPSTRPPAIAPVP